MVAELSQANDFPVRSDNMKNFEKKRNKDLPAEPSNRCTALAIIL